MERQRWAGYVWIIGGAAWITNGLLGLSAADGSTGFYVTEAVWIPVHLLVGAGLVALRRSGTARVRAARIGLGIAIAGRLLFLVGELAAIAVADDDIVLFPIAAVSTAVGMLIAGAAISRRRVWHGWARFTPLAMGAYPFVAMFPLLAITGERPNLGVAGWGLTFIAIGAAVLQQEARVTVADGLSPGPATTSASVLPSR